MKHEPRRTDPRGFVVKGIMALLRGGLPAVVALLGSGALAMGLLVIGPAIILMTAFSFGFTWLAWRRLTYTTGRDNIRVEHGLLSRHARAVPYDRIQDVSLEQKLLPRLFGLAEVKFETGAGGKDEISLSYLSLEEADRLRELVRERKTGVLADTVEDAATEQGEPVTPVLFAMDDRRIVTFGLFEFSLVIFAVLLGAAQQLDFLFPFDWWEWRDWKQFAGAHRHDLDFIANGGRVAAVLAVLFGVIGVALLGVLTGVARTFAREYGFTLERTAKGFRRRRGLFTRSDVIMPVHRVQGAQVRTGWLRRRFGWYGLSFVSLASDAKSASHTVVPFARMDEISPVLREAGFDLPGAATPWHKASSAYPTDRALLTLAAPALIAGGLLLSEAPALALIPLFAGIFVAVRLWLSWRHAVHAMDNGAIFTRHGWLAPSLDIGHEVKVQSVELAQGPLARRRGYATLRFGIAGGQLAMRGVPLAEARAIARQVADSASAVDFSALPS